MSQAGRVASLKLDLKHVAHDAIKVPIELQFACQDDTRRLFARKPHQHCNTR